MTVRAFIPGVILLVGTLVGCGSPAEKPPTAQEASDFRGKPISAEQKARGMAAAMSVVGRAKPAKTP